MQVPGRISEVRLDKPELVEGHGEDHDAAGYRETLLVSLQIAREQQRERNQPVEEEVEGDDDAPAAADAVEVPVDLVGQVARPDDEELAEVEINIEHHESKRELAQVVLLGLAKDGLERLGL